MCREGQAITPEQAKLLVSDSLSLLLIEYVHM
jgi:hypothetical protein